MNCGESLFGAYMLAKVNSIPDNKQCTMTNRPSESMDLVFKAKDNFLLMRMQTPFLLDVGCEEKKSLAHPFTFQFFMFNV